MEGLDQLPGFSNYFIGSDPKSWRTHVPHYAKIRYRQVYPGIDLLLYGNQSQLKYDLVITPGARPQAIQLAFEGATRIRVDDVGDLVLQSGSHTVRHKRPVVYQGDGPKRDYVAARYVLRPEGGVGFEVAPYDASRPLVIDPVVYSTYIGGSAYDIAFGLAVDRLGNAYVTGFTASVNFPTTRGAFQQFGMPRPSAGYAFVTKLNADGSALVYSTFLAGSQGATGRAIAVDSVGNAYVAGFTESGDYPTTEGASDRSINGAGDVFVTKLGPTGAALVYSTYLGGTNDEQPTGIALDPLGNCYIVGYTVSSTFPTTPSSFQQIFNGDRDAFVTKLNATGSALVYSTYLGGPSRGNDQARGIAVDGAGSAYVVGVTDSAAFPTTAGSFRRSLGGLTDGFVTRINTAGTGLVYSTYLGGGAEDEVAAVAVDAAGNAYVTGRTGSSDFPITGGAANTTLRGTLDGFIAKLNPAGSALAYSSYLGGSDLDIGTGLQVDFSGNVYVTGSTRSRDFPVTRGSCGSGGAFVSKLVAPDLSLAYSSCVGFGAALGVAIDLVGNAYVCGGAESRSFPASHGAFDVSFNGDSQDAFVFKIDFAAATLVPAVMVATAGNNQVLPIGTMSETLTVSVNDPQNRPVPGVLITWSAQDSLSFFTPGGELVSNPVTLFTSTAGQAGIKVRIENSARLGFPITVIAATPGLASVGFQLIPSGRLPVLQANGLVNAASFVPGLVPGGLASLFGGGFSEGITGTVLAGGVGSFRGTSVLIGGTEAPVFSITNQAGQEQINLQVPFEVVARSTVAVQVNNNGARTTITGVPVYSAQPGIFEVPATPAGPRVGAVIHVAGDLVTPTNPAMPGEIVSLFLTGAGPVEPPIGTGVRGRVPPARTVLPVTVTVSGVSGDVLFSGYAPGFIGLYQINFEVPFSAPSGPFLSLSVKVGDSFSKDSTIAVR